MPEVLVHEAVLSITAVTIMTNAVNAAEEDILIIHGMRQAGPEPPAQVALSITDVPDAVRQLPALTEQQHLTIRRQDAISVILRLGLHIVQPVVRINGTDIIIFYVQTADKSATTVPNGVRCTAAQVLL